MDTMGTLLLGTVTNGCGQTNQSRLVLLAPCLDDRVVNTLQVSALKSDKGYPVMVTRFN
jgi:hypothetical protein